MLLLRLEIGNNNVSRCWRFYFGCLEGMRLGGGQRVGVMHGVWPGCSLDGCGMV